MAWSLQSKTWFMAVSLQTGCTQASSQQCPWAQEKEMIPGLPKQGTIPILQGTLCTTTGPSLGELAHQEPWERSPLPARTPMWGDALKK